jgi:hypothetical protein
MFVSACDWQGTPSTYGQCCEHDAGYIWGPHSTPSHVKELVLTQCCALPGQCLGALMHCTPHAWAGIPRLVESRWPPQHLAHGVGGGGVSHCKVTLCEGGVASEEGML